mmetsp:Transcript_52974/g.124086  ORF Transcript_52974/g.124086 Transcript_52974/m.124086 type:complete len:235 (-) Transcript_52974:362-1066(-)
MGMLYMEVPTSEVGCCTSAQVPNLPQRMSSSSRSIACPSLDFNATQPAALPDFLAAFLGALLEAAFDSARFRPCRFGFGLVDCSSGGSSPRRPRNASLIRSERTMATSPTPTGLMYSVMRGWRNVSQYLFSAGSNLSRILSSDSMSGPLAACPSRPLLASKSKAVTRFSSTAAHANGSAFLSTSGRKKASTTSKFGKSDGNDHCVRKFLCVLLNEAMAFVSPGSTPSISPSQPF